MNASIGQWPALGALPGRGGVDPVSALLDCHHGVGHAQAEVVMSVNVDLRRGGGNDVVAEDLAPTEGLVGGEDEAGARSGRTRAGCTTPHLCQTTGDSVRLSQALAGKGVKPLE
jgi:hypothetical protein